MTTYRLMDGVAGRPGVGSSGTQPPASPVAFTGSFEAGQVFAVTSSGLWFGGYWWWVPAGGDTGSQKFCLYALKTGFPATGTLIPAATVTSGTLTAGQWNYVPLPAPVPLSVGQVGSNAGGLFQAQTGWTAVHGFPDTGGQLNSGGAYPNGWSNGPLACYGASNAGPNTTGPGVSSVNGTSSADPATGVVGGGSGDLMWLDVQVDTAAPAGYGGSYRLWPNRGGSNGATTADAAVSYVIATEIRLSQACTLDYAWYWSPPGTAQLATRAGVYSVTGANSGTEVAAITSPSWSGAAASGWVRAAFPGGTTLPAGSYKVYVYNGAATPDQWGPKDATTDYFGQTLTTGEAPGGITWGPISAPGWAASSQSYQYDSAGGSNSPPFSDGTGSTVKGQPTFAIGPPVKYPYLYAPVGAGVNQTQNYWVDLEVTPIGTLPAPTRATGGRMASRTAETYRFSR